MEIRFFLTRQDLWYFQKQALWRVGLLLVVIVVLLLGITPLLTTLTSPSANNVFTIVSITTVSIFALFLLVAFILLRVRYSATGGTARILAAQGELVIMISPEGFRYKNNLLDSMISWRAIKEIKTDAHNLYFMVDSNVTQAVVIPWRAFSSQQDADTFMGWAKTYWAQGHGMQQPGATGSTTGYERWG